MNDDERTVVMNTGDDEIFKYGGWIGYCKGHKKHVGAGSREPEISIRSEFFKLMTFRNK